MPRTQGTETSTYGCDRVSGGPHPYLHSLREVLNRVEVFKYLGRLFAYDNDNAQAVRVNIKKARVAWSWISKILRV